MYHQQANKRDDGKVDFANVVGSRTWRMTLQRVVHGGKRTWGLYHGEDIDVKIDTPFAEFEQWGDAVQYALEKSAEQTLRVLIDQHPMGVWRQRA